jgi:hypothetical protein
MWVDERAMLACWHWGGIRICSTEVVDRRLEGACHGPVDASQR